MAAIQWAMIACLLLMAGKAFYDAHHHTRRQIAQPTPWWGWDPLVEKVRQEFLERKIGPIEYEFKIGQIVNECLKDSDDISGRLWLPRKHSGDRWEFNEDLELTLRPHQPKPQPKPRYTPSLPHPGDTVADTLAHFEAKIQKLEAMVLDAYRVPPYYPSSKRSISRSSIGFY